MFRLLAGDIFDIDPVWEGKMRDEPAISEHARARKLGILYKQHAAQVRSQYDSDQILPMTEGKVITVARPDHNRLMDYCIQAAKISQEHIKLYSIDPSALIYPHQSVHGNDIYTKEFDEDHYSRWMKPVLPEIAEREDAYKNFRTSTFMVYASLIKGIESKSLSGLSLKFINKLLVIPTGGMSEVARVLAKIGTTAGTEAIRSFGSHQANAAFADIQHNVSQSLETTKIARTKHLEDLIQEFGTDKTNNIVRSWDHSDFTMQEHAKNIINIKSFTVQDLAFQESPGAKLINAGVTLSGHVFELSRIAERRMATGLRGRAIKDNQGKYNDINYTLNFDYPKTKNDQGESSTPYWMSH